MVGFWCLFFTKFFWLFAVSIPVNVVGVIAVRKMNKNYLTAFSLLKSVTLALMIVTFSTSIAYVFNFDELHSLYIHYISILIMKTLIIYYLATIGIPTKLFYLIFCICLCLLYCRYVKIDNIWYNYDGIYIYH